MLLDTEKSGTGPRRLTRAVAFLEAAGRLDRLVPQQNSQHAQKQFQKAADRLRDMAVEERNAHDTERKLAAL